MQGEQTISNYNFKFKNSQFSKNFEIEVKIPKKLKEEDFLKAVIRINNISLDKKFIDKKLKLNIFLEDKASEKNINLKTSKKVTKIIETDKDYCHINFNYSITKLFKKNEKIKIRINSNITFRWKTLTFSLYSETI